MSDTESVDYLQGGFDPWSLTVPRLRSILVTYNVSYPATAKKQQLVDLFNDQVAPQSKKILAQRARAKRSSYGIVDVESSQDTAISTDDTLMPPPSASTRRARSPRKTSTRVKKESEEPEHLPEPVASPTKRKGRASSRQTPLASDTDTDSHAEGRRSVRKPRRSELPPQVKAEESDEDTIVRYAADDDIVFTSDNPFQSGSSPPPVPKTPTNRRRTAGVESTAKKPASSAARRRTDGPVTDDAASHFSKSFEIPVSRLRSKTPEAPVIEAGEEFTPDEQLALEEEEPTRAQTAIVPQRRSKKRSSLTTPLWVLATTLLGAYAAWYRQEKIAVGYCGLGRPATQIIPPNLNFDLPDWAVALAEPQCEPCPPHAYCYEDYSVRCEQDFILKNHPLSVGGLVPIPPTCEPDGEKVRRVQAVADKAVEELRERRAKYECGELEEEEGKPASPSIAEPVLKETVSEKRNKKMSKQEFDDLWAAALGEIESREEIQVEPEAPDTAGGGAVPILLSSTSLSRVPITCAVRRSVRLGVARHRFSIGAVVASILSLLYARSTYRSYRATAAKVPGLVNIVLERLATQKELAYEDGGEDDPFLFLPNLRDDVLRNVHSVSERERIWQRVRAVVEQNSNVRTGQREGHNGEVGRAWEWIGPSSVADTSFRRRRSGRVSWGPDVKGEDVESPQPQAQLDMSENRTGLHRKWDEPGSRPIY